MSKKELEQILRIYYPVIKLERRTYMLGLERWVIIEKDGGLFVKTCIGHMQMEAMINLNFFEDCMTLVKFSDYVSSYKDNVMQQLYVHKAKN